MKVVVTEDYSASCRYTADLIEQVIREKHNANLGLATGESALGVYDCLIRDYQAGTVDFSSVSTVNLDEYLGLEPDDQQSYHYYMEEHLFRHINIRKERTYVPCGTGDPQECIRSFRQVLRERPTDLQLLGIGTDGHVGFNEPGDCLHADAHIESLDPSTVEANARFFPSEEAVPRQAISMGLGNIMRAGKIVLIATGESKARAIRELLSDDCIGSENPSTMLKMHPDVTVVIDRKLAKMADYQPERTAVQTKA